MSKVNVNKGFLSRAFEKPIDKEFEYNSRIWKLIMTKGNTYHIKWLTDLTTSLPLRVHFPNIICDKMYSDSMGCEECEKVVTYKGVSRPNTPKTVWAMIGYCFDLVGKVTISIKNGKEYEENPVKIIETSSGKGSINFENLEQYHNSGILKDDVWVLKRLAEGGFDKPTVADTRLLGKHFNSEIPEDVLANFDNMSEGDLRGIIFASYKNAKFDHPDVKEAGINKPDFLKAEDTPMPKELMSDDPLD